MKDSRISNLILCIYFCILVIYKTKKMIKKFLYAVWTFSLQKGWNWIWSKTTVDEQAIAAVQEVKERTENVIEEFKDVKESVQEVVQETKDVVNAAKGKPKRKRNGSKEKLD